MGCNPSSNFGAQSQPPRELCTVPELWRRTGLQYMLLPGLPLSPALPPPPSVPKAQRENNSVPDPPLCSSPSSGTKGPPQPQESGGAPCLRASHWHSLIPPQACAALPAPAGSTEEGRAARNLSLDASPLHGTGAADIEPPCSATSSVPEPNCKVMLNRNTLQSKPTAPCPQRDAAEDTGTNPTGCIPIPAGSQGNAPSWTRGKATGQGYHFQHKHIQRAASPGRLLILLSPCAPRCVAGM